MPDEPLEVQTIRAAWEGRARFAKEILTGLAGLLTAVAAVMGAWYVSRVDKRVDQVEQRTHQTGKAVDDLKANARVVMYAPPPEKKE